MRWTYLVAATVLFAACGSGEGVDDTDADVNDRVNLGETAITPDVVEVVDGTDVADRVDVMDEAMLDASPDASDAHDAASDGDDASASDVTATGVEVAHTREFRAAWVATVYNINFPSRVGLSASAQRAELTAALDVMVRNRLNAIVFQVRPEGDAFYRSSLEPWSRFLTGRQGGDPGYDPLGVLVEEAHRRAIEVHAWFNPYRARATASSTAVAPHIAITHPTAVVPYDNQTWMNPASLVVQDRLAAVIRDVVTRYAVDGVHFDDYFYPYPETGMPFPDAEDYARYRSGGGTLSLGDWRRDNVNRMVQRVSQVVAMARADARFGVSPFGIYRPGIPVGISGLDAYAAIYCDPVRWMREGWVDYLAPQLYWPSTQTAQAYGTLIAWWSGLTSGGRSIFAGNNLGRLGSTSAWTVDEIRRQITLTREQAPRGARGNIWFTLAPFRTNTMGVADAIRAEFYQRPVLTPPLAGADRRTVPIAPAVRVEGRTLRISHVAVRTLRAWVLYRTIGGRWEVERIEPATTTAIEVSASGRYAVSAANRYGDESLGTLAVVP